MLPEKQKTHRQQLRVGLGLVSRNLENYPMPVSSHALAPPQ
jgi:hypothetical protein